MRKIISSANEFRLRFKTGDKFWYLETSTGSLPEYPVGPNRIQWINGEVVYVARTLSNGCVLEMICSLQGITSLKHGVFASREDAEDYLNEIDHRMKQDSEWQNLSQKTKAREKVILEEFQVEELEKEIMEIRFMNGGPVCPLSHP